MFAFFFENFGYFSQNAFGFARNALGILTKEELSIVFGGIQW